MKLLARICTLAIAAGLTSAAAAETYHVRVWNGAATNCGGSGQPSCLFDINNADRPPPSSDPLAAFDFVTGDAGIDWASQGSTYLSLLDNGSITGFDSATLSQAAFMNSAFGGGNNASYFEITGLYNWNGSNPFFTSIMHNAGASLYVDNLATSLMQGGFGGGQLQSGNYSFENGLHNFSLYYIAGNAPASALIFDLPNVSTGRITAAAVPEPASVALLGIGLVGLALMRARRRA